MDTTPDLDQRGPAALACGRIGLGLAALAAPAVLTRAFGMRATPELDYMTRIFGARAIALGTAWWTARGTDRERIQRIGLAVDVTDTLGGAVQAARRELPPAASVPLVALTAGYAAVGAAHVARSTRSTPPDVPCPEAS